MDNTTQTPADPATQLLAAVTAMLNNVERWLATGIPADAAESKALYAQLRDAVDEFGESQSEQAMEAAFADPGVDLNLSYACALGLANLTADRSADTMTITLTGVTDGCGARGDWSVTVNRIAKTSGESHA